jgi:hypothetical protein
VTRDVEAVLVAATRDLQLPKPTLLLIDIRDSSVADIRERLTLIQQRTMARFVAFVVPGMARDRLAQIYRTQGEAIRTHIEVFPDAQSARAWLVDSSGPQR